MNTGNKKTGDSKSKSLKNSGEKWNDVKTIGSQIGRWGQSAMQFYQIQICKYLKIP